MSNQMLECIPVQSEYNTTEQTHYFYHSSGELQTVCRVVDSVLHRIDTHGECLLGPERFRGVYIRYDTVH